MAKNAKGHGKEKGDGLKVKTPEEMYQHFLDYKKYCKDNPKRVEVYNQKFDKTNHISKEVPLTLNGFDIYMSKNGIIGSVDDYLYNRGGRYDEFVEIMEQIGKEIWDEQYSGAAAGVYNHAIVIRKLGLADKQEVKTEQKIEIDFNDAD